MFRRYTIIVAAGLWISSSVPVGAQNWASGVNCAENEIVGLPPTIVAPEGSPIRDRFRGVSDRLR